MTLQKKIEEIWGNRDLLQQEESKTAIREVIALLDRGEIS